jgi:N-acetylmuramoyl-L-alanine amidase
VVSEPNILPTTTIAVVGKKYPLIILDAGHGGLDERGNYVTAPSKMWEFPEFTFHEGVFNRQIVKKVASLLDELKIPYEVISHEWQDTPLKDRIDLVNRLHRKHGDSVLFSIHANAANTARKNFHTAKGYMVFTSPGDTASDKIASVLFGNLGKYLPTRQARKDTTDGDVDYEANFAMLVRTLPPSVLVECGFFTNEEEARFLLTEKAQWDIAMAVVETIKNL